MIIEIKKIVEVQQGDFGESWPDGVGIAAVHLALEGYSDEVARKFIEEVNRVAHVICGGGSAESDLTREGEVIHRAEHLIAGRLLDGYGSVGGATTQIEGMAINEAVMSIVQRSVTSDQVGEKLVAGIGFCNDLLERIRRGIER